MVEFLSSYFSGLILTILFFFAGKFRPPLKKHMKKWIKSKIIVLVLETLNLENVSTRKNKGFLT